MQAIELSTPVSEGLMELENYFSGIRPPYTLNHIQDFNRLYQRLYPVLDPGDRVRAEEWVDRMIDNVERKEWASRIYGVV
jgi:hypothetical protein